MPVTKKRFTFSKKLGSVFGEAETSEGSERERAEADRVTGAVGVRDDGRGGARRTEDVREGVMRGAGGGLC